MPQPSSHLTVADHRLEYVVQNDGGLRPTLVFLHEGLGSLGLWRAFPEQVVDATRHRALVYSRLGHGWSDVSVDPRPLDFVHREAVDVLPVLIDRLDADRPILIGHSDGASISLVYAALYEVTALVLLAPHVFVEKDGLEKIRALGHSAERVALLEKMAKHHRDPAATFRAWNDVWLSPGFMTWNIEDVLSRISCPVLLIQGLEDEYGTLAQIDAIESQLSGPSERFELADCGHSPHLSQPEKTLQATARFIETVRDS